MSAVDVELIAEWAARVLEPDRRAVFLRDLSRQHLAALGAGFSAVRAAVLGEDLTSFEQDLDARVRPGGSADGDDHGDDLDDGVEQDPIAVALHGYLVGIAAGIAATGADREPTSLVAGLVTGAAQLRFSWPLAGRYGAVDLADRVGLAAADMSGEGADLEHVVRAVDDTIHATLLARAGTDSDLDAPADRPGRRSEADDDDRLRSIIQGVLGALHDVLVPANARDGQPKYRGGCRPRRFLAEVRFTIDGPSSVHLRIVQTLNAHGTAIVCSPSEVENVRDYHLHTVHPGAVVSELYAIATPFGLTIDSTEPPLDGTMP